MGSVLFDVGAERCAIGRDDATRLALRLSRLDARHLPGDAEAAAQALRDVLAPTTSVARVVLTREQAQAVVEVIERWLREAGVVSTRVLELLRALRVHYRIEDGAAAESAGTK